MLETTVELTLTWTNDQPGPGLDGVARSAAASATRSYWLGWQREIPAVAFAGVHTAVWEFLNPFWPLQAVQQLWFALTSKTVLRGSTLSGLQSLSGHTVDKEFPRVDGARVDALLVLVDAVAPPRENITILKPKRRRLEDVRDVGGLGG
ncbi:hypothetical protein Ae201684P_022408 [Aphanomyces euteiches]|nr:hypothetical protein Ae201684P_022408 [Aphanomyces euteiches]